MPNWIIIVIFFVVVFLNTPIAIALAVSSIIMIIASPTMKVGIISGCIYNGIAKFVLLAIPYFILAGIIMEYSGISKRLVNLARVYVGHRKGGLIIVITGVSCFFGAISGSGTACIAAIGGIMIPAMVHDHYDRGFSTALVSISAGIGMIIPPSITFVVYAMVAGVSIIDQFTAGIFPGLLLGVAFTIAGLFTIRNQDDIVILPKASKKMKLQALKDAAWGLISPIIILGGIYSGVFTPTEAAGISVVYCLFVGFFVYKELKFKDLKEMAFEAAKTTAMIMFIISFANIFSWYLATSGVAVSITSTFMNLSSNKYVLFLMMDVVFLIAGCFLDPTSICFILVPIFIPLCKAAGINLIHFGVVYNVACLIGLLTPPVGTNLYVGAKIGGISATENAKKALPFIVIGIVTLIILTIFPEISLILVN